jgi:hypothetical protein
LRHQTTGKQVARRTTTPRVRTHSDAVFAVPGATQLAACHAPRTRAASASLNTKANLAHQAPLGNPAGSIENLASPIAEPDGWSAAMNPPPDGLPTDRLLTGVYDDRMHSWVRMPDSIEHVP